MDRVPICFIEEVVLQLEKTPYSKDRKYPSIWGEVANKKLTRERAYLHLYLKSKEQAYFCVYDGNNEQLELDRIGQFVFVDIKVTDDLDEDWNTGELPKYHPLTKKNFQLLQNVILKPFPCSLELYLHTNPTHPLVQRLFLAIPRVAEVRLKSQVPLSMDTVTQSIERGTLKYFSCYYIDIYLTHEMLSVFLRFVASEQMNQFEITLSDDSPVSYEALLNGVIDAVLRRKRGCRIGVDKRYGHLCARLEEETARVKVLYDPDDNCLYVKRDRDMQ
uniref:Tudor domain-containing protein n=1 Tax=Steinernema glaseri TaxID=37863 RepID=A0A1I8ACU5_9BILA